MGKTEKKGGVEKRKTEKKERNEVRCFYGREGRDEKTGVTGRKRNELRRWREKEARGRTQEKETSREQRSKRRQPGSQVTDFAQS